MNLFIGAVGRMKQGPFHLLYDEYKRRLRWPVSLYEVVAPASDPHTLKEQESRLLLKAVFPGSIVVALDEKGDNLSSLELARLFEKWQQSSVSAVTFLIGGAQGHGTPVHQRADALISFGRATWPHMMARIMLIEQLYRAQQIINNHPYHKE